MSSRIGQVFATIAASLVTVPVFSENVSGVDKILCAPAEVIVCHDDGYCETVLPWKVNVPQFIVVDIKKKRLSTTEASGANRSTPIKGLIRESGMIYLQGVDRERAFSFVINEGTGLMTVAVARAGLTVTVFGACTSVI